jgi:hypothetical protein
LAEVQLAKLRSEHYGKTAAKLSRTEWGEQKQQADMNEGVTVVIALADSAGRVIDCEVRPVQHNQAHAKIG